MKKDVNKKKTKLIHSGKNLERKLKINMKKCLFDIFSLKNREENYKENTTFTTNLLEFNQISNSSNLTLNFNFNYSLKDKKTELQKEDSEDIYKINSYYHFIKEPEKEKIQQRFQESDKTFYSLFIFEEKVEEERVIKMQ